jgi:hypothetical protein
MSYGRQLKIKLNRLVTYTLSCLNVHYTYMASGLLKQTVNKMQETLASNLRRVTGHHVVLFSSDFVCEFRNVLQKGRERLRLKSFTLALSFYMMLIKQHEQQKEFC